MEKLLDGYQRFREGVWPGQRALFEALAKGQRPNTLVVSCIDSRVDPALVFDADPGEMLVIRNVANLVPPYAPDNAHHSTSASLEFGVKVLNIPHIIVMGHGQCGGVHALLVGAPANAQDFIAPWMSIAKNARTLALQCDPADRQQNCEHEVVRIALANLLTYPWIMERVETGRIKLHGAWLNIGTGELMLLQPDNSFALVGQAIPKTARNPASRRPRATVPLPS